MVSFSKRPSFAATVDQLQQSVNLLTKMVADMRTRQEQLATQINAIETWSSEARNFSSDNRNLAVEISSRTATAINLASESSKLSSEAAARVAEIAGAVDEARNEAQAATQAAMEGRNVAQAAAQAAMEGRNFAQEGKNLIIHANSQLATQLNQVLNVEAPRVLGQIHEALAAQIESVAVGFAPGAVEGRETPKPDPSITFEWALAEAKKAHPSVYDLWKQRLDDTEAAFAQTIEGNAAHAGDAYSRLFRAFVQRHARGAVVDVGCGPLATPYYLEGYPSHLVCGLEPLAVASTPTFQRVRGISEYLPWADGAFDTVISATSLDHCVSLDQTLAEMRRVLSPHGVMLFWIGSIPGSPPFRPLDPAFAPADQYHLFHFDTAWFEPLIARGYEIADRQSFDRIEYSHVFYALKPKGLAQV
jgi:SAM-dependent methyltransferase